MKKKISRQIQDSPPPQGASDTISGLTLGLCVYHLFYPNSFPSQNNIIPPNTPKEKGNLSFKLQL